MIDQPSTSKITHHKRWVKTSHWIVTISFFLLAFTGFEMIMVHPRFYWGEVGNDLTPALFELPVSRNYKHSGWENTAPFFEAGTAMSASRTYDIFNQNGWGRSLHFLSAWLMVATGLAYLIAGIFSGHFRRNILPRVKELSFSLFWRDVKSHLRRNITHASNESRYGLLQKSTYFVVIFFLLPLAVMTGFTMSPALTAAYPFLLNVFFGAQSARTIHLFASLVLELFLLVHVVMVIRSGFTQNMRAMTIGK